MRLIVWSIVGVLFVTIVTVTLVSFNPLPFYRERFDHSVSQIQAEIYRREEARRAIKREQDYQVALETGKHWKDNEAWEKAIHQFDKAILANRRPHEPHCLKTQCLFELERYEDVVKFSSDAILTFSKCVATYSTRGKALEHLGRYEEAIASYLSGLKVDPECLALNNNLAWLYAGCPDQQWTDGEKAMRYALKSQELLAACTDCNRDREWVIVSLLGAAHSRNDRFEEAIEFTERAIQLSPDTEHVRLRGIIEDFERGLPYVRPIEESQKDQALSEPAQGLSD